MADSKQPQRSYVGGSLAIVGKPNTTEYLTPNLHDRVLVVRKDGRKAGYKLPLQGSKYDGPNAERYCDFKFATSKSLDQLGWENWYYLNERRNQSAYNFEISYPYASKDYPTVTRTFVFLRGDQRAKEPDADTMDPVYGDLYLTDHKVIRLQQPELDALFVGIQRVYERLPGPVITSQQINQYQQDVTIQEQEDVAPTFPTVSAVTEIDKLERKTTAKAKTTVGTTDVVFPDTNYKVSRDDAVIPYRHRKFLAAIPSVQVAQTLAGQASIPTLADTTWDASDHQTTLYKHQISSTVRNLTVPVVLLEVRLTKDQQTSLVTETWAAGFQTFTPSATVLEADVIGLGNNESIKSVTTVGNVFPESIYTEEIPDPVPLKFRVAIPVTSSTQVSAGTAVPPVLGTGDLEIRDEQTTLFKHRLMRKRRDPTQLPRSLVNYELTPEQQVATVTETLAAGLQNLNPVTANLIKGSVDDLGNNTSLLSASRVPTVFHKKEYSLEIPDIIPQKFRVALPTKTFSQTLAGTAALPVLGTGELERRDTQETDLKHRTMVRSRSTAVRTVLVSYKMTRDKQIETVIETFNAGLQTISPTALTIEADVTNLGNNTSISSVGSVPTLFTEASFETTIPDLVPPEFKASVPTRITEVLIPGTAQLPVLGTGDISATEKQVNEFVFRNRLETRAGIALPKVFTNQETTREFGGGDTNVIRTLNLVGTNTLDEGLVVLKSEIKNLGNGMELKETQQLNGIAWPPLPASLWDDNMRVQYTETKQVVTKGTSPTADPAPGSQNFAWVSEVKSVDTWRSLLTTTGKSVPYFSPATALITREFRPYRFPGYLQFTGIGYYTRAATAVLVEHVIRTWWIKQAATPTIVYDRIITADAIINNLSNTGLEYARNVLHDGFTIGILSFPPTTPTATEYALGELTGSNSISLITMYAPGQGVTVGATFNIGSTTITVTATGVGGSIASYSPVSGSGITAGSYPGPGGSLFIVTTVSIPTYGGTPWIGTERIIDASVIPEKEPNMWKLQTKSVIMQ